LADVTNAEKYYSLALENKEFELKPHAMFSLARLLETQGKTEQAIAEYKNILNSYSDSQWANLANSRLILIDTQVDAE
jgi:TolA-binding protein